jgi:mRNA interferase RelE/StbE
MSFRIRMAHIRIKKHLRRMPKSDVERIKKTIAALAGEPVPPGAILLAKDIYRIRVGDYRVIYKVFFAEKVILIGRIVRRNEKTYKDFKDLFG